LHFIDYFGFLITDNQQRAIRHLADCIQRYTCNTGMETMYNIFNEQCDDCADADKSLCKTEFTVL